MLDDLTFEQAMEWLEAAIGKPYSENQLFYEGDHWQDSKGWLAQIPDEQAATLKKQIEKAFVYKNMIAELVDRHVGAVVGREPSWSVVPSDALEGTDADDEQTATYEALLTEWWDKQRVLEHINTGLAPLLYAGRAVWRLYVSPAVISEANTLTTVPPETTWRYLYFESVPRESAAVYHSKELAIDIGLHLYVEDDLKVLEVSYVDEQGLTQTKHINENEELLAESAINLGRRLPVVELNLPKPFITGSMVKNQMALNLTETMMSNNTYKTGFNELILFNAQLNGYKIKDANGNERFIPYEIRRSPGAIHNFLGVEESTGMDDTRATPSGLQVEPFDPAGLIAVSDASKRNLYEEAKQLHAMISGDAVVSGEARVQATADFEASLRPTKARVDALLRWVLATALDFHLNLIGSTPDASVRVTADALLSASVPTVEMIRIARENFQNELWSQETTLTKTGIEDPQAEIERLERERDIRPRIVVPGELDTQAIANDDAA